MESSARERWLALHQMAPYLGWFMNRSHHCLGIRGEVGRNICQYELKFASKLTALCIVLAKRHIYNLSDCEDHDDEDRRVCPNSEDMKSI